ncbi:MAG: hypothetical protein ACSHYB_07515 [Roseibacillus sp.]
MLHSFQILLLALSPLCAEPSTNPLERNVTNEFKKTPRELLSIDNGAIKIGIDRAKGASITWLSWRGYPKNTVNEADPGRLIQQSYYAGRSLDRTEDGQHEAWSPWNWNPIQGGGVGSWAKVTHFDRLDGNTLFAQTTPKLWDMPDEDAEATMKQWTSFEPDLTQTVVVKCLFESDRQDGDRWGPARNSHQEVPALYFTRNFDHFQSYLGNNEWRDEIQIPGPPWGKAHPPRLAMACFEPNGQGIAIFSPTAGPTWNFGPHSEGQSSNPKAGPCVHIAPVSLVKLGPQSSYHYRYWLTTGTREEITKQLDLLWGKYSQERGVLSNATSDEEK